MICTHTTLRLITSFVRLRFNHKLPTKRPIKKNQSKRAFYTVHCITDFNLCRQKADNLKLTVKSKKCNLKFPLQFLFSWHAANSLCYH